MSRSVTSDLAPTCLACDGSHASLVRYHREVASQLVARGRLAAARIQWNILQALDTDNLEVKKQLVMIRERIQQETEQHLQQGKRAFKRQQYRQAERAFLAVLALNPFEEQSQEYLRQIERSRMRKWLREKIDKYTPSEGKM